MASDPNNADATKKSKDDEDLSEEDLALKQQLELYVQRVEDSETGLQRNALESMRQEIRSSTSSMTSVPKPLKFLRPHYATLKAYYETMVYPDLKKLLADILSVLALTMSAEGEQESLKYRLLGSEGDIDWGHAYVRNLAGEVSQEYVEWRSREDTEIDDLMELTGQIVVFLLKHNAEHEVVDLLIEVKDLSTLADHVDRTTYERACMYLISIARYLPKSDDFKAMDVAHTIYMDFHEFTRALQTSLFLNIEEDVQDIFRLRDDLSQKKQFCFILARHGIAFQLDDFSCKDDNDRVLLQNIINNRRLTEGYLALAHDIQVMEPKTPADIYKAHLLDGRGSAAASVDTPLLNLASTYVNAFVNAGFQQDRLTMDATGEWLFKNEQHGRFSATASLGMIHLWDVDAGLASIDKYLYNNDNDNHIVGGALLAAGIVNCGIKIDSDPALALFNQFLDEQNLDPSVKLGAIMGMGLSYAGTKHEEVKSKLISIIEDANSPLDVIVFAAISLGLVFVGTCNSHVTQTLLSVLQSRIELAFWNPLTCLLPLSLGLNLLGKQDDAEAAYADVTSQFHPKIRKYCDMTLLSCAYAGTGNLLEVQHFLGHYKEQPEESGAHLGPAVVGIAMVAMAEEVGLQMAIRSLENLSQYGEPNIRRAVPLALALLCISDPKVHVANTLSRLSRDEDIEVVMAALISLGLIGAGTNNGRIACILRNLSSIYHGESNLLFFVRIAQGLLHMGKGLLTLAPYHSDQFLLCPMALAGIIILLHACLNTRATILGKYHYVIYYLVLAMQPRMLMTVDKSLTALSVPVRVGQAVNDGQAGRPRTITSSETHSTPVILGAGDRAELETDKYIPLSPFLEGFVILRKNPNYREDS